MVKQVRKVVCYAVQQDHLLVFTHKGVPLEVTGVQVPAGTIRPGEEPADAAVRELQEETRLPGKVSAYLGESRYDLRPMRHETAARHFFSMEVPSMDPAARWDAGEPDPEHGGPPAAWTCWWMPLAQAHVLAAGLGANLGELGQHKKDPRSA
ncbi:NUDIX domain-containing protein [Arthrobacter sp. zg-Y179]|uniref:NUDIX domain-containing protein n=1 Tax=Arthrobacter sp. zg-Y179 TaxID=2894188 RepID=UPI001E5387BF|nr:NUDIX domain-containing protein [Arthrobacter sp. zg-Y179]MCC9176002.1 NUDIX domain-containing protein [Arthrobacter sp. zg-Y179]